jgi:hypothetical protein
MKGGGEEKEEKQVPLGHHFITSIEDSSCPMQIINPYSLVVMT